MRDPSHTRALTATELLATIAAVFERTVTEMETREVEVDVERWLTLTRTPAETANAIRADIRAELAGGQATGMRAFATDGKVMFCQTWAVITARFRNDSIDAPGAR
jgi:hypothetical protein